MRSNATSGQKVRNAKCAAMWPSEKLKTFKMRSNAPILKKNKNAKCAVMWLSEKLRKNKNAQQCA